MKKENEELKSRREFFKKAAKSTLPILGTVVFSQMLLTSCDLPWVEDPDAVDCKNGCSGSCGSGCSGSCDSSCSGSCDEDCTDVCAYGCTGSCDSTTRSW